MGFEIAALLAAFCWALGGLFATEPARALGGYHFSRIRMTVVFVGLAVIATWQQTWGSIEYVDFAWALLISGLIGIVFGDVCLFAALGRLGPRRTGILFAANAPITAIMGVWLFDESMSWPTLLGCALVSAGVVVAIYFGKRKDQLHNWEQIRGPLWVGLLIGLGAALGQSIGSLVVKPVMDSGADAVAVSAVRVGISALALQLASPWVSRRFAGSPKLTWPVFNNLVVSGVLGMLIGMPLLLYAFAEGDIGLAAILSSTTPVMILPLLWIKTRERPALGAWIGALLTVLGSALLFQSGT